MDASAWTRIKRGKALSSGVGLIQPNTSGDVLMERRFVNGPILFNGKVVSECCDPAAASFGTIVLQFSPVTTFAVTGNTLSFDNIDGTGTVDFGNGIILPISAIVLGKIYPVGSTVTIRSTDIIDLTIDEVGSQGLTSIVFNKGIPMFSSLVIRGSTTLTSLDISAIASSLLFIECSNNQNLSSIIGLEICTQLIKIYSGACSLSGPLNITGSAATLGELVCDNNPGITEITDLQLFSSIVTLTCGGCSLSGPLNITGFAAGLDQLFCSDVSIIGLENCTRLRELGCIRCNLSGTLDLTPSAPTIFSVTCTGNADITYVDIAGCSSLESLTCDGCSISQGNANSLVGDLVANGLTGGTLIILDQVTGTLNSSGWTALGNTTGSTGLGWFIS